jgi:FdhD protein
MSEKARRPGPSVRTTVVEVEGDRRLHHEDRLATEEPLELRLTWPGGTHRLGVTMRTPGHDFELAAGWVVHEQVLDRRDVLGVRYCSDEALTAEQEFNVVTVEGRSPLRLPEARWASSACGVCGSDSLETVLRGLEPIPAPVPVTLDVLRGLPERMRAEQPGFDRTGGLHAAALAEADGTLVAVREDVGRHNAVDKVVGARLLAHAPIPPVLVLSGRVGFELVQKAVVAGVSAIVAVGAPTSLAAELATRAGLTLVGFTRPDRCVVYAGAERIGV